MQFQHLGRVRNSEAVDGHDEDQPSELVFPLSQVSQVHILYGFVVFVFP